MDKIDLLVTIDKKYIDPLITMMRSYVEKNSGIQTRLYIANSVLDGKDIEYIESSISSGSVVVHNIKITDKYFSHIPLLERIPEESFYRLLAFLYLPYEVEKCLYLDPDIIINKSIIPLYNTDIEGKYIAAAGHTRGITEAANHSRLRLGDQRYINSGVMLMNLKKIRRDFTLDDVLACLEKNVQKLIMGDQDLANILFGGNMVLLDERIYNLDERTFRYYKKHEGFDLMAVERDTVIIHYNGRYKPWLEGYRGQLDVFYPTVKNMGAKPKGVLKKQIKSIVKITKPKKHQLPYVIGCSVFLALLLFSYIFFGSELVEMVSDPVRFRAWLDSFGIFDEMFFIILRAAQTAVKFLPAEPLEIGAGYAWGAVNGMLYCLLGNIIGSLVILFVTRRFGRDLVSKILPLDNSRIIDFLSDSGSVYFLLFLLYLIPGSPKDGITYIVGLLPVKILPFMIITSIARIPSIISSTMCGHTLAREQFLLSALIFIATAVIAIIGAWLYKNMMEKKNREKESDK